MWLFWGDDAPFPSQSIWLLPSRIPHKNASHTYHTHVILINFFLGDVPFFSQSIWLRLSRITHIWEACVVYIYVCITHMTQTRRDVPGEYVWVNESCHAHDMTWLITHSTHTHRTLTYHTYTSHDLSHIHITWLITHHVSSHIHITWLITHTHHSHTHHTYTSHVLSHIPHASNTYQTHKCFSHESHTCDFFKHTATHTATHTAIHTHECFSHVPHTWHIRIHYVARLVWRASYAYVYLFAKEPLIIRLFCGKRPMKIRHPMTLRHPACHVRHMPMGWLRLVGSLKW